MPPHLPKPAGIPDDWIVRPTEKGGGTAYVNPANPNDRVRVMPGDPDSPFPMRRVPYVIDQQGGYRDVNGSPIPGTQPGPIARGAYSLRQLLLSEMTMSVDLHAWRKVVEDVVAGLADEALQKRSWFGAGPEESSPDEEFNMFFDDAAVEQFLDRSDNGLSQPQQDAGKRLAELMRALSDETPDHIDPSELIDDPRWKNIRAAANRFSELLRADVVSK
jgi:hypothetical protein